MTHCSAPFLGLSSCVPYHKQQILGTCGLGLRLAHLTTFFYPILLQFDELCKAVATLVGSQATDSVALLQALEGMAQARRWRLTMDSA